MTSNGDPQGLRVRPVADDADWAPEMFDEWYMATEGLLFTPEVTARESDLIARTLGLQPGERVLDLACGHGRHAIELARRGLGPVTGLDFTPAYLERARRDAAQAGVAVTFVQADMRTLPFEAEFDAVYNCFNSMFYWDDATHLALLEGIRRALRPGGRLFIEVYNRERFVINEALGKHRLLRPVRVARSAWRFLKRARSGRLGPPKPRPDQPLATKTQAFDLATGVMRGTRRLVFHDGRVKEDRYAVRLYTLSEVVSLLERAGFGVVRAVSSPDEGPYTLESPRLVVVTSRGR